MSARRRLRTRYERVSPPEPAPAETSEAPAEAPAPDAATPEAPPTNGVADAGAVAAAPEAVAVPGAAETPVLEPAPVAIPVEPIGEPAEAFEVLVSSEGAAAERVERPRRSRVPAIAALIGFALLAFVTGLILFNNLVMPRLIHGVGQVTVPDLTNLTVDQAEQALRPLGLQLSRAGERFDPSVPRGFVLSQDPESGIKVRGRKRISVVVSLGEEFSSVPELSGESVRGARLLIDRAGLRTGAVVHAPSEDVGEDLVAGSDPGPETVLQRDTQVNLLVSTGPGQESFVMPDLVGREIVGVRRQLEALGFRVITPPAAPSLGTIVSQKPAAGSRITRQTQIEIQATGRMIR